MHGKLTISGGAVNDKNFMKMKKILFEQSEAKHIRT